MDRSVQRYVYESFIVAYLSHVWLRSDATTTHDWSYHAGSFKSRFSTRKKGIVMTTQKDLSTEEKLKNVFRATLLDQGVAGYDIDKIADALVSNLLIMLSLNYADKWDNEIDGDCIFIVLELFFNVIERLYIKQDI